MGRLHNWWKTTVIRKMVARKRAIYIRVLESEYERCHFFTSRQDTPRTGLPMNCSPDSDPWNLTLLTSLAGCRHFFPLFWHLLELQIFCKSSSSHSDAEASIPISQFWKAENPLRTKRAASSAARGAEDNSNNLTRTWLAANYPQWCSTLSCPTTNDLKTPESFETVVWTRSCRASHSKRGCSTLEPQWWFILAT